MDGRSLNKGGAREGAGNPGYGKLEYIKNNVIKYSELWWKEWEDMMHSKPDEFINDNVRDLLKQLIDKGEERQASEIIKYLAKGAFYRKQFAMTEYNKLQAKMIPQDLTSGGDKLPTPIYGTFSIPGHESDETSVPDEETD